jgi:glycosyltransferase involved in cell wall biosynthesis
MLIPPHDRSALAHALTALAEMDAEELMILRRKSLSLVKENFLWSAIAEKNLDAIEKITFTLS